MAAPDPVESVKILIQHECEPIKLLEAARRHLKTKKNQEILASELLGGEDADFRAKWQRLITSKQKLTETEAREICARIPEAFRALPGGSRQAKELQSRFAQLAAISDVASGSDDGTSSLRSLYSHYLELRPLTEAYVTGKLYDWALRGDWSLSQLCPSGERGRDDALAFIRTASHSASRWVPDGELCPATLEEYLRTLDPRPGHAYHSGWESLRDRMQHGLSDETYCRMFSLTLRYWVYRAEDEPQHPGAFNDPTCEIPNEAEQLGLAALLQSIANLEAAHGQG